MDQCSVKRKFASRYFPSVMVHVEVHFDLAEKLTPSQRWSFSFVPFGWIIGEIVDQTRTVTGSRASLFIRSKRSKWRMKRMSVRSYI